MSSNLLLFFLIYCCSVSGEDLFSLNVLHVNDFHSRYEETSIYDGPCKDTNTCVGGLPRLYTKINNILKEKPDSILLNAGDNFQGTLYYNLFKWNMTQFFLNLLPFDAFVLGNHEFDDGVDGVVPFIKNLKAPVVVCNINSTLEPSLNGLYNKSVVIERGGKKIGIIGVITAETSYLEPTGKLIFYDEASSINCEAERLVREEGVFTIIVLSHCGYDLEKEMAKNAFNKIGLIVGAHSHTFLDSHNPPIGYDTPKGPYPTVIKRDCDGKSVLVVQASAFAKYLGEIKVFYDDNGDVVKYEGGPIFLDHDVPQDENIKDLVVPYKEEVDKIAKEIVGHSLVLLYHGNCTFAECNIGNLVADLLVQNFTTVSDEESWTSAAVAVVNPTTFRTSIEKGDITNNDLFLSLPFKDTIDSGDIQGKYIKEMLEYSLEIGNLLQVSGLHVIIDPKRPRNEQVRSIKVRCSRCQIPIYEDLDLNKTYRIVVPSYLREGGDGYSVIEKNLKNVTVGHSNLEIYRNTFKAKSPLYAEVDGRIKIIENYVPRSKV